MSLRTVLTTLDDGFYRGAALREARARAVVPEAKRSALRQAMLLIEVARRVADPIAELPGGARPAVMLGLTRDAIRWTLVAARPGEVEPPTDLRTLWETHPPEALAAAAGDPARLDGIKSAVLGDDPNALAASLAATEEDARRVGAFAQALVTDLDAPRRHVERLVAQRVALIFATLVVLALIVCGGWAATRAKDLAADKPFQTSSVWAPCPSDANCAVLAFCTDSQLNPWATLDLGRPTTFHRIEVTNRADCCAERAVPLIVEVSTDDRTWRPVARRDAVFAKWTIDLAPTTGRYVRFTVPKQTVFHLAQVSIY